MSLAGTLGYRVALGMTVAVAAVALFFFAIGLGDGSVSSFNIGLWLVLLGGLGAVVWAGHTLRSRGKTGPAIGVLSIVALPGLLAALFMLLILILQPRWN